MQVRLLTGPEPQKSKVVYPDEIQVKCAECGKYSLLAKFQGASIVPGVFFHVCPGKDSYAPPEHFNCRSKAEPFYGFDEASDLDLNLDVLRDIMAKVMRGL